MKDIPVKDHPNLVRRRGAIVNTDHDSYIQYITNRNNKVQQDERISSLEGQVSALLAVVQKLTGIDPQEIQNATEQEQG